MKSLRSTSHSFRSRETAVYTAKLVSIRISAVVVNKYIYKNINPTGILISSSSFLYLILISFVFSHKQVQSCVYRGFCWWSCQIQRIKFCDYSILLWVGQVGSIHDVFEEISNYSSKKVWLLPEILLFISCWIAHSLYCLEYHSSSLNTGYTLVSWINSWVPWKPL